MVMYIGGDPTLDLKSNYLVSPIHTPDHILAQYPRTYIITGEKDPLVDDSIIFMAKLRQAKRKQAAAAGVTLSEDDHSDTTLKIVTGVSHAFMQMTGIVPEMRDLVRVVGEELVDMIRASPSSPESSWGVASTQSLEGEDGALSKSIVQVNVQSPKNTKVSPRTITPFALQWEQQNTRDAVTIYEHRRVAYLDQLGIDTHDD